MRKLVLAATEKELENSREYFRQKGFGQLITFETVGVGAISTSFFTQKYIVQHRPDIVMLGGIAGSFDQKITLGKTFLVGAEKQATVGVEEDDHWKDVFEMGFANKDALPFKDGWLVNPFLEKNNPFNLPIVHAISVDEITTNPKRRDDYISKYHPILESMEGAAFHFVCLQLGIPFLQVRSISNYVGERDKLKWDFPNALKNLNHRMISILENLG